MCAGMGSHGDSRHNRAIFVSSTGIGGKAKLGVSRPVDQGIFQRQSVIDAQSVFQHKIYWLVYGLSLNPLWGSIALNIFSQTRIVAYWWFPGEFSLGLRAHYFLIQLRN